MRHRAGDNHQIGLARRRPESPGAETLQIVLRRPEGHHFEGATGQAKRQGPDRIGARPIDRRVERNHQDRGRKALGLDVRQVMKVAVQLARVTDGVTQHLLRRHRVIGVRRGRGVSGRFGGGVVLWIVGHVQFI